MTTIANLTPDTIEWWHVGVNGFLNPGDIKEFDDGRAAHILTKYGPRGIVQMSYGDKPEDKKESAMTLFRAFWEKQVTDHNRMNEDRRENKKLGPINPTKELEEKAKLLGLELIKPWRVEAKESQEVAKLRDENKDLRSTINRLSAQVEKLTEFVTKTMPEKPALNLNLADAEKALTQKVAENRKKYKPLTATTMSGWLRNNWEEIPQMPEENRFEITTKYQDLYQLPFPNEKPD